MAAAAPAPGRPRPAACAVGKEAGGGGGRHKPCPAGDRAPGEDKPLTTKPRPPRRPSGRRRDAQPGSRSREVPGRRARDRAPGGGGGGSAPLLLLCLSSSLARTASSRRQRGHGERTRLPQRALRRGGDAPVPPPPLTARWGGARGGVRGRRALCHRSATNVPQPPAAAAGQR